MQLANLIPKPICKENCIFYSDRSPGALQQLMQEQLNNETSKLSGSCSSEGLFKVSVFKTYFQVEVHDIEYPAASLQGKICLDQNNKTSLICSISIHWLLPVLFFLFPLVGIAELVYEMLHHNNLDLFSIADGFIIIVPVGTLLLAYLAKQQLLETFERSFDLRRQ